MTTLQLLYSFMAGPLVVIAYREMLFPGRWLNILVFYPIFAIGAFLTWGDTSSFQNGLLSAAVSLPIFVGAVFLGSWAEAKLAARRAKT